MKVKYKYQKMLSAGILLFFVLFLSGCTEYNNSFVVEETLVATDNADEEAKPEVMEGNGLSVTVEVGCDRYVKPNRFSRVTAEIVSEADDFTGYITAKAETGIVPGVAYKKDLSISKGTTKRFEIAVPILYGENTIAVGVENEEGELLFSKDLRLNLDINTEIVYAGLLTDQDAADDYFSFNNIRIFVITPEDFPEDELGLDMLDILLLDNFDEKLLNSEQQSVFKKFTEKSDIMELSSGWELNQELYDKITSQLSVGKKIQLDNEKTGHFNNYAAYGNSWIQDPEKIPAVWKFALVIFIYLLLIGLPLYFILKKIGKSNALWLAVPSISILFTFLIYVMGSATRLKEPFAGYLTVTNIEKDQKVEENYFTITSPYNKEYQVEIPRDYSVLMTDMNYGYLGKRYTNMNTKAEENSRYGTAIIRSEEGTEIEVRDNAAFSTGFYKAVRTTKGGMQLDANLTVTKDFRVNGIVTNNTDWELTNVCLSVGDIYIPIGDLKQQEMIRLDNLEQSFMPNAASLYYSKFIETLIGEKSGRKEMDEYSERIYNAYQYYFENRMSSFYKKNVVLTGIINGNQVSAVFDEMKIPQSGIWMCTIESEANYTENGETFISNLDPYMEVQDNVNYDSYRYMNSEAMRFKIQFNKDDVIKELIYSKEANIEFKKDKDIWDGFYGVIKGYNYETDQYEELFHSGEEKSITYLEPFLNDDNGMQILIESDGREAVNKSITVPVLSAVKEEK